MRKNIMNKVNNKVIMLGIKADKTMDKVLGKLKEKNGNFFEEGIKYVIAFVLGALMLAGLYALIKNVILPSLSSKTQEMFNYTA